MLTPGQFATFTPKRKAEIRSAYIYIPATLTESVRATIGTWTSHRYSESTGAKWNFVHLPADRTMSKALYDKLVAHVNRKQWWHVPPVDPDVYKKRGKFYSVSFEAAEFWGRPLDEPERVTIAKPLVGDEKRIGRVLGIPPQREGMTLEQIADRDVKWRNTALKKGFDAIVLMSPKCFAEWKTKGNIPRSLELNVLDVRIGCGSPVRSINS